MEEQTVVKQRESAYVPLDTLLAMRWADNPKLHQDALIEFSVNQYGFKDPIGIDLEHQVVCEGHGRLGVLQKMRSVGANPPLGVETDDAGNWLIPCELLTFDSVQSAWQYALIHNRSGTSKTHEGDYDLGLLRRALDMARTDVRQGVLTGFEDLEGLGVLEKLELHPLPALGEEQAADIFDASKLEGVPDYQVEQAPQTMVIMVTAPDFPTMVRMLRALTSGQRNGLPANARFCSVDGMRFVEEWERRMLSGEQVAGYAKKDSAAVRTDVLPGQITLTGDVVEDPAHLDKLSMFPKAIGVEFPSTEEETPASGFFGLLPPISSAMSPVEREQIVEEILFTPSVENITLPTEPKWKGGLCPVCGGSGHTGYRTYAGQRTRIICVECGGAGDQESWRKSHQESV